MFDREWGATGRGGQLDRTRGDWVLTEFEEVEFEIKRRAGEDNLSPLLEAVKAAYDTFREAKEELLPVLDAAVSVNDDQVLRKLHEELSGLQGYNSKEDIARSYLPRGQVMSRDMLAIQQGLCVPHHLVYHAWLLEQFSYGSQLREIARISRHAARYLEQKYKMKGKTLAKTDGKIFIGHGRSDAWNQLKDFVRDRLNLDYDEFNRESSAGLTAKERLATMLDNACFAFLVMTAEDEHADGSKHARENIIHEIGLFQGRLGFERAIILLEDGCQEFSNIHGIQQIRFRSGELYAVRDDIRHVLERENIIK